MKVQHKQSHSTKLATDGNVISFFSNLPKAKYSSLSNLYNELKKAIWKISPCLDCHLVTFPYVAVQVHAQNATLLKEQTNQIKDVVETTLWNLRDH